MNVHVAHRRKGDLAFRLIAGHARRQGSTDGMQRRNPASFDFERMARRAGGDHRLAIILKPILEPYIQQTIVIVVHDTDFSFG